MHRLTKPQSYEIKVQAIKLPDGLEVACCPLCDVEILPIDDLPDHLEEKHIPEIMEEYCLHRLQYVGAEKNLGCLTIEKRGDWTITDLTARKRRKED